MIHGLVWQAKSLATTGLLIKELKQGAVMPMQDQNGNRLEGRVVNVGLDKVKMDFKVIKRLKHPYERKLLF